MNNSFVKALVLLALAAVIAVLVWHFRDDLMPANGVPSAVEVSEPAIEEPADPAGPAYPLEPTESPVEMSRKLQPLPDLDDSDAYFLLALIDLFGAEAEFLFVNEALIDKIVVTIDNLPRKHVAERLRPVGRLTGDFRVDGAADDNQFYLSSDNYARYDLVVGLLGEADLDSTVETYRRFYPLFQESYERLGYPDAYFNDRVVEVIDHLLETPIPDEPVLLMRPHVLYEFADPELEKLSAGQKLLLRMGSEHAETAKGVLRALRTRIS